MAHAILNHPIHTAQAKPKDRDNDTYSNTELLEVLELEDPLKMAPEYLEELINGTDHKGAAAVLRAYLVGIHDAQCMFRALRPDLFAS